MFPTKDIINKAAELIVYCGGCAEQAHPRKVLGMVAVPQHDSVRPYAVVEYACDTHDCGQGIQLEVDL